MNSNFFRFAQTASVSTLIAFSALALYTASASAIEFNLEVATSGNTDALVVWDTFDVDMFIDNPTNESYLGVGVSLLFDPAVYELSGVTDKTLVDIGGGPQTPILIAASPFGVNYLDDVITPNEQSPGVVLLVNALNTSPASGDGSFVSESPPLVEVRPHASVQLTVIAAEGDGTLDTGFGVGQILLSDQNTDVSEQAIFDSVVLTVPEPGATALGLVALSSVIGVVQIRRRFEAA